MDIINFGHVTSQDIITKDTDGRAFDKLTQRIEYKGEEYLYEKWYNDKYVEEYLDNSKGELVYQKIYNP